MITQSNPLELHNLFKASVEKHLDKCQAQWSDQLKAHVTYLDSCGERDLDLDLEREAERCPLRSADLRDADRSLREWLEADLERDLERLRSLRDVDNARHKTVVYLFSYM